MDLTEHPYLFPFFFIGLWLFICAFFAVISGWLSLARDFRAGQRPEGEKVMNQVKRMGVVRENMVTHMIVSESGLYLYASLLFRFLHPPLLIPWSRVRRARKIKTLWWHTYDFDLASITNIRVTQKAYNAISKYKA